VTESEIYQIRIFIAVLIARIENGVTARRGELLHQNQKANQ
jgi:hypothetical protein